MALQVRKDGQGVKNLCQEAAVEHAASTVVTAPLVEQILYRDKGKNYLMLLDTITKTDSTEGKTRRHK